MPAAFFDMDHTLLDGNSGTMYTRYSYRRGRTDVWEVGKSLLYYGLYRLNRLNIESIYDRYVAGLTGRAEQDMIEFCRDWFEAMVKKRIFPEARLLLNKHRRQGDRPVIISNATQYIVRPVAEYLEVEDFLSTTLEVERGQFTGRVRKPLCYGEGKSYWADRWARRENLELASSWFYTDSYSDLPFLKIVGHPVAVNADGKLRAAAQRRGWPILDFKRVAP